jgi:hypothetical protein
MAPTRQRKRLVYPVAFACVAVLLLTSCHSSSKNSSTTGSSAVPSTDAKGKPRVSLALQLGALSVQATNAPKPFDPAVAKSILKLVNNYIGLAITRPLFTGLPATGLVRDFSSTLASRVGPKGHDRGALTDERAPVITEVTSTEKQPLKLVGLEDNGRLVMIGAQFGLTVKGTTAQGPLTVARVGNFVFEADAAHHWYISGYDLIVRRDTSASTTTTKATTTTAAP